MEQLIISNMSATTIYRFEYQETGIYQAQLINSLIGKILNKYELISSDKTPSPGVDEDFRPHMKKVGNADFVFGFTSVQMLLDWFPIDCVKDLIDVAEVNLLVITIDEQHVFSSKKQCIFSKSSIQGVLEITSFEEAKKILIQE